MKRQTLSRRQFSVGVLRLGGSVGGAALLAACGSTPTPQVIEKVVTMEVEKVVKETVVVEKAVTPTPAAKGKVELQFWAASSPEDMQPFVDEWNGQHPDMPVTFLFTPGVSSVGTNPKFLAATLGGNPPDVFIHDGSSYTTSILLNAFTALDDLAQRDLVTSDLYWAPFWPKVMWKGHLYGLPLWTDARCLYWNKAFFEEAGLADAPKTISELDVMAEELTKGTRQAGYDRVGFIPWSGNWFLCAWGWAWGAELWDESSQKMRLNCPEMVEGLTWETTYAEKYGVEELSAFSKAIAGETTNPFTTENVAMEANGNWMLSSFKRYNPDLDFAMAPVPVPQGREFLTWSGGFVGGIPRGVAFLEEAWQFLKWLGGKEFQLKWCELNAALPVHREASEEFVKSHPEQDLFVKLLPTTRIEPVIPEWALAWDEFINAEQEALYGRKSPQRALDDANAKVQDAIDARLEEEAGG